MTNEESIAIVTPSFERDFELCRTLNRSVMEFLPPTVRQYIIVDRRDLRLFLSLDGERTTVLTKEEILPKGFAQLPRFNRWFAPGTLVPIHGWLVQQIAKIAIAAQLSEASFLMVDSDAVFVRDVDLRVFAENGRTRLYAQRGGVTADMLAHATWQRNACSLLGVSQPSFPADDYIGQVISWRRDLVLAMCRRVEEITSRRWYDAIARARQFSEYMLYGVYVERVAGLDGNVWIDENPRCNSHWETSELSAADIPTFVGSLADEDFAMMINAHSKTSRETRATAISLATNGRL